MRIKPKKKPITVKEGDRRCIKTYSWQLMATLEKDKWKEGEI
jgi:hypothetical protein